MIATPITLGVSGSGGFSPPVMFFFLGMIAALVKSNLRVPRAVTKLLSLYLLWAIGFRGGVELNASGFSAEVGWSLGASMLLAFVTPVYAFFILKKRLGPDTAAAVAGCYGSISAVTFVTAKTWLEARGISSGGHMVAAMALMESPAIVVAMLLLRLNSPPPQPITNADGTITPPPAQSWGLLLHEAFLNGPVLLLLGSLAIGMITGSRGYDAFKPLCTDLFSGVLVFFLLDLGLVSARKLRSLRDAGWFVIAFAIVMPLFNACVAIVLAKVLGMREGNAILLTVLAASASYIAVPAAMRIAIPKANQSIYIPLALAITFPFNIAVGIPLYAWLVRAVGIMP
jgi:hypothetical protein